MGDKYIEQVDNNITFKFLFIIIPNSNVIFIFHVEVFVNVILLFTIITYQISKLFPAELMCYFLLVHLQLPSVLAVS